MFGNREARAPLHRAGQRCRFSVHRIVLVVLVVSSRTTTSKVCSSGPDRSRPDGVSSILAVTREGSGFGFPAFRICHAERLGGEGSALVATDSVEGDVMCRPTKPRATGRVRCRHPPTELVGGVVVVVCGMLVGFASHVELTGLRNDSFHLLFCAGCTTTLHRSPSHRCTARDPSRGGRECISVRRGYCGFDLGRFDLGLRVQSARSRRTEASLRLDRHSLVLAGRSPIAAPGRV